MRAFLVVAAHAQGLGAERDWRACRARAALLRTSVLVFAKNIAVAYYGHCVDQVLYFYIRFESRQNEQMEINSPHTRL